jgi:c-di-GMP-binding flagellar brake protein YcgR
VANKRSQERHELNVYLEVRDGETGQAIGRIVDLTTGGLRLVSEEPLSAGHDYDLLIETDIGGEAQDPVRIDARCTWSGRDVNPDFHAAGLQFQNVRPRQQTLLARVIRNFRFQATR